MAMKVDVAGVIGAVVREVRACERDGQPARAVIATRTYDTSIEDLWDAITSEERIPRWFLPVSGDLRLGGRYQLEGNAGGSISECDPPRRVAITWEFAGAVSWVTVQLAAESRERTRLQLEHVQLVSDHWKQFGPGATGVGWDLALMGLELYVASHGVPVDRSEGMAWVMSAEGKNFSRRSSEDWCRAHIASGTIDEAGAKAAAMQTAAAYTGDG
jgi:uncharacterized protein YndB with AHSA1/START domain